MEDLIKVDILDNEIGRISKTEAHQSPVLHRAFSVFLFSENRLLLQRRAFDKYHSGGLIANTCCSHPRTNDIFADASKRLFEEVGILYDKEKLTEIFNFTYLTKFNNNLFEYEFDHVLVGEYSGNYKINKNEVDDIFWVDIDDLAMDLVEKPELFASWFIICAPKVIKYIKNLQK